MPSSREFGTSLALAGCLAAASVSASTVDLLLTGKLTSFGNGVQNPNIFVGADFQIKVSYSTDAAFLSKALDPTDSAGYFYQFDNTSLVMTFSSGAINGFTFANDVHGAGAPIRVRDNYQQSNADADTMRFTTVDLNNDVLNGHSVDVQYDIYLFSRDTSLYNITNNSIPLSPPDPASAKTYFNQFAYCRYESGTAFNGGLANCADGYINGTFTGLQVLTPAVPEPQTYALLLAGLVAVSAVRARRPQRA